MSTKATDRDYRILRTIERVAPMATAEDVGILRRAERTLHHWCEQECGDGNDYCSWCLERDEETNIPYRVTYPHTGTSYRTKIADRETSALKRVKAVCDRLGLFFFYQGDCRGCALYVGTEPLTDTNYSSRGVAVCV